MWNFADLRAYLLPLAQDALNDVDKIVFPREFGIEEWLTPAHLNLCQRPEAITMEEATKIGIFSLLMVSRLREQYRSTNGQSQSYCNNCGIASNPNPEWHVATPSYSRSITKKHLSQNNTASTTMENKLKTWIKEGRVTD